MTATVTSASGTPVHLSPTGVDALLLAHADHLRHCWTDPAAIHPTTRQKLMHAGLIAWADPDAAAIDQAIDITPAGIDAALSLQASTDVAS